MLERATQMTDAMNTPPAHLPANPADFYRAGADADLLLSVPPPETPHVLEQLGPPTFRKTTFPIMGFLASLYEHVAASLKLSGGNGDVPHTSGGGADEATPAT